MIKPLVDVIRHNPIFWMLIFVPVVLVAETVVPASHTLLFVLAVLAIVPLAALRLLPFLVTPPNRSPKRPGMQSEGY